MNILVMDFQAFLKGADSYILGCFFQDVIRTTYFCPSIDSPKRCASSGDLKTDKNQTFTWKKKTQKRLTSKNKKKQSPASSKWPFDHPNGGHLTLEKVT